jgi:hypothetical protein
VNFLKSVLNYASTAWGIVSGIAGDPGKALIAVWHFIGSVQSLIDRLFSIENKDLLSAFLFYASIVDAALRDYLGAIERIAKWIWGKQVLPVYRSLRTQILALRKFTVGWIAKLIAMIAYYYLASIRYTYQQVSIERAQRAAAILQTRQYAIRLVKGCLSFVQREASDGYNSQTKARESVIDTIADDLAVRNPAVRDAVKDLIKLALDAAEVDDPLLRAALAVALGQVVDKLGIDKAMGALLSSLIADLTGGAPPSTLQEVAADIAKRLAQLETAEANWWASGGPELEQAGEAWKGWAGVLGDAALVAFFVEAAADPTAWATQVNDTAGAIVDSTFTAIADLIKEA